MHKPDTHCNKFSMLTGTLPASAQKVNDLSSHRKCYDCEDNTDSKCYSLKDGYAKGISCSNKESTKCLKKIFNNAGMSQSSQHVKYTMNNAVHPFDKVT